MSNKTTTIATAAAITIALAAVFGTEDSNRYEIIRVIDGDTVVFKADFLPDPLEKELSLRILGIDTPEDHFAKCEKERALAKESTRYVEDLISKGNPRIQIVDWDKFGGRVLGHLYIDGVSIANYLVDRGYAVVYNGSGERKDWCANE